jgi:hypothetical protein
MIVEGPPHEHAQPEVDQPSWGLAAFISVLVFVIAVCLLSMVTEAEAGAMHHRAAAPTCRQVPRWEHHRSARFGTGTGTTKLPVRRCRAVAGW